ncbi:helix-turn-helix domain-containing protein [Clostridiaceae bacterium NSJ-31]|uniref:Helix-turn-helix domain-containing protein n=1 Tax=Ligaoa zhengdingensis TaxID=2763658 RepID=A0A926DVG0_9FIRM|nr:helix-turn-helix domain-containing protein [Ligaoa zhengdingensis]
MKINNRVSPDNGTKLLAAHIRTKGISIKQVSDQTGISYDKLIRSLSKESRALKTDEFLCVCQFLEVDPMRFYVPQNHNQAS